MLLDNSRIIDGKKCAKQILSKLEIEIGDFKKKFNYTPHLAIVLIGENPASIIYVRTKLKTAEKYGMKTSLLNFPLNITQSQLVDEIIKLNLNPDISGIIVQLPLPKHIDKNIILSSVDPEKDVDGFHPINIGYLHSNSSNGFVPCTALGCIELIKQVESDLTGKYAVVIGRSDIVGRPLSALLLKENCTVTICHSKTKNLSHITNQAEIIVAAMGVPLMLTGEYFNNNSIVIDVGITKLDTGVVVGDVNFTDVVSKVRHITPVPGGVGPMTVAFLLKNTLKAALKQNNMSYN